MPKNCLSRIENMRESPPNTKSCTDVYFNTASG